MLRRSGALRSVCSSITVKPVMDLTLGTMILGLIAGGVLRKTLNGIPAAFPTAPSSVYRGSSFSGDRQGDASFSAVATAVTLASLVARGVESAVLVEWDTASELDNLGFHLYRGLSADGPWTKLNSSIIPGLGSSPEGKQYRWVDGGLANGTTYFYRLEDVDRRGGVTSHGPVSATPLAGLSEQAVRPATALPSAGYVCLAPGATISPRG